VPSQYSWTSFAGALGISLAIVEVGFDWATWVGLNVSVLYSLPLVFAAAARRRRLLWTLTVILVCMTFAVYLSQAPAPPLASRPFLIDRGLSAISILLSAAILDTWLRSLLARSRQELAIQQQNARLAEVNGELVAQRAEISRKNEELERRAHEMEDVSRRKTQMLASISHDVRSPIQAIVLMAELIQRSVERPEHVGKIPAVAKRLQANAISISDFLTEVIDLASFDAGRTTAQISEFRLGELIAAQCERVLPIAESKGLALIAGDCDIRLRTDRVKLGRIIGNLIGNAIKFTSTGSVTVSCGFADDGRVFISVRDTGRGIKPEDLGRIFAEFAQIDRSASGGGWGLGLAISHRMTRLLGGDIEVESELQKGSVFTVFLPPPSVVAG
jgi:signal transduction histidine kinase